MADMVELIPGFTPEQSWAMQRVAEQAARNVWKAICEEDCRLPCKRMEDVHGVVFGHSERGIVGLGQRMDEAERTLSNIRRLTWIALTALFSSVGGWLFLLIQIATRG